jgi:pimeloyl-ACP methyl ester carboxylesterase
VLILAGLGLGLLGAVVLIGWRFSRDVALATARAAQGGVLLTTRCGPIEYQEAGTGFPLLVVHGSGGGHDQGMAFAGTLARQGVRVIAMSRFGYLGTPMPTDASAAAQADAHECLLDALGIGRAAVMGGSAGAPSALQMAIRHPHRVSALSLLVPLAYKPPTQAGSAPPMPAWVEAAMMRLIGSDLLFWAALHVARDQVIQVVLATPPELLATANPKERARVNAMLDNILPVSTRAQGLRSDSSVGKHLAPSPLESVHVPTLIVSARDDGYGTYASAQYTASRIAGAKFVGFDQGGHVWVGHNDEVMAEILKLLDLPVFRLGSSGTFSRSASLPVASRRPAGQALRHRGSCSGSGCSLPACGSASCGHFGMCWSTIARTPMRWAPSGCWSSRSSMSGP